MPRIIYILFLSLASISGQAKVSSYAPLKQSALIENAIDSVLIRAEMSVLKRPIALSHIESAYQLVCSNAVERDCRILGRWLQSRAEVNYAANIELTHQTGAESSSQTANERGLNASSTFKASAQLSWEVSDHLIFNLGGQIHNSDDNYQVTPEDSYISLGWDWAQMDIGYKAHWFSPFHDSAMIISTHAETLPTFSILNTRPLTWLNFNYEVFVGEMSTSNRIRYQGGYTSGKPILTGMHFGISPVKGFHLGVNRLLQSGGGRGKQTFSDLLLAVFDPYSGDNTNDELEFDEQYGNQVASFVSSFDFYGETPFSVYAEYAGEDTARRTSWRLGNSALSFGVYIPNLYKSVSIRAEWSQWQNAWYAHSLYHDGLTNNKTIIGNWGASERMKWDDYTGEAIGANLIYLSAEKAMINGDNVQLYYRQLTNHEYENSTNYQGLKMLGIKYQSTYNSFPIIIQSKFGNNVFDKSFFTLSIGTQL